MDQARLRAGLDSRVQGRLDPPTPPAERDALIEGKVRVFCLTNANLGFADQAAYVMVNRPGGDWDVGPGGGVGDDQPAGPVPKPAAPGRPRRASPDAPRAGLRSREYARRA